MKGEGLFGNEGGSGCSNADAGCGRHGDGARVDETQQVGDFDITLLGIASGHSLMNGPAPVNEDRIVAGEQGTPEFEESIAGAAFKLPGM